MATVRLSKKGSLQWQDFVRGALIAVGTAVLTEIQQWFDAYIKHKPFELSAQLIGMVALGAFITYLAKNGVFEKAKVITTVDTNLKAENATEKIKDVVA